MPRENEMQELIEKCRWEWTDVNSVKGYKITGPSGKSIFLPSKNFTVSGVELWHGYYWSKTRYSDSYSSTKWGVCILTSGVTEQPSNNSHSKYYHDRYDGFYVRPVSSYWLMRVTKKSKDWQSPSFFVLRSHGAAIGGTPFGFASLRPLPQSPSSSLRDISYLAGPIPLPVPGGGHVRLMAAPWL